MENVLEVKTVSIEQLEQQQAEAVARAEQLTKEIAQAKVQQRAEDLHKIIEIANNLETQFGDDFVNIVKTKYAEKEVIVLTDVKEIAEYKRFALLIERGYKVEADQVSGKRGLIEAKAIISTRENEEKVVMNQKRFKELYARFK